MTYVLIVWFFTSSYHPVPTMLRVESYEQCVVLGDHLKSEALGVKSYECFELAR